MSRPLRSREQERLAVQQELDRQRTAAERNRLGQFATPTALARDMAALCKQLLPSRGEVRLLDPAAGSGVFFSAARLALGVTRLRTVLGFEIDPSTAAVAERLFGDFGLSIRVQDFCTAKPVKAGPRFTAVLCNPPYVRHHHLSAPRKASLRREAYESGFHVSGLAGLYCYFLLLAHRWLAPDGVGVWVVPAEFLDVNYGQVLKDYLTRRVALHRIHRFDPEDTQFSSALVSSVVIGFVNAPPPPGHRVVLSSGRRIFEPQVVHELGVDDLDPNAKWGPLFRGPVPVEGSRNALRVGDLFAVKRGLATGANHYFILDRERARDLGLPEQFLRPILPGPRYVPRESIDAGPGGFPVGLPPLVLLDCPLPLARIRAEHSSLARYLRDGETEGIARRYLPAHRRLWYQQEQRPPAPILCTYMGRQNGGRGIRFIRNKSNATAPNVYLLLYPRPPVEAAARRNPEVMDQLFGALAEVASTLPRGGRVYGGGLNKIEPKELEAIELSRWVEERFGSLFQGAEHGTGRSTRLLSPVK
jgi:hypothetical protein